MKQYVWDTSQVLRGCVRICGGGRGWGGGEGTTGGQEWDIISSNLEMEQGK